MMMMMMYLVFLCMFIALYQEFAEWYVTEHEVKGLKNTWDVFQTSGTSLCCNFPASKCRSDLVRLQLFDFNS
jgi:hypothetical protein